VIVTGMGKSGHVARKIAATLASTGTPAFSCTPPMRATAISA
jgi:arabinose-5-phosphate isomerase